MRPSPAIRMEWEQKALSTMRETGAFLENGHFVFTAGDHSDTYVNKDRVISFPHALRRLTEMMVEPFRDVGVEVVVGPAVAGAMFAQRAAEHLNVFFAYADKDNTKDEFGRDTFILKRGYQESVPGKRVLIVEDVLTTGDSTKKVVELVKRHGGIVIGVSVLWNRKGLTAEDVGAPELHALINKRLSSVPAKECVLCQRGVPVNSNVGHGKQFLASKVVA
jgi:orotate phosphoribosyltransferase